MKRKRRVTRFFFVGSRTPIASPQNRLQNRTTNLSDTQRPDRKRLKLVYHNLCEAFFFEHLRLDWNWFCSLLTLHSLLSSPILQTFQLSMASCKSLLPHLSLSLSLSLSTHTHTHTHTHTLTENNNNNNNNNNFIYGYVSSYCNVCSVEFSFLFLYGAV
jgi:hypothetical protein